MALRYVNSLPKYRCFVLSGFTQCASNRLISSTPRKLNLNDFVISPGPALGKTKSGLWQIRFAKFSSLPPHTVIKLPNLSPTMETGTVVSWAKNEGDEVGEGDLLAEIETDKATMSFDASDPGFLAKILAPAGTKDIPVGTPLCIIVEEGDSVGAFKDYTVTAPPTEAVTPPKQAAPPSSTSDTPPPAAATVAAAAPPPPPPTMPSGQRVFASPLARRMAAERGIDLTQLAGTKPGTVLRAEDVSSYQPSSAPMFAQRMTGGSVDLPVSDARALAARGFTETQLNVPHYYLTTEIEMDEALKLRDLVNATLKNRGVDSSHTVSLNDVIVKAVAATCLKVPDCNSSWQGTVIRQFNTVDVNISIATPAGLINPLVCGVETKGLLQLSDEIRTLAEKAKTSNLQQHEVQTGTFTVSNLSMFGITASSAIIYPPQACLLTVGSTQAQLCPDSKASAGYAVKNRMTVTLSCDHRVVDGAVGASWLSEFKSVLEQPGLMLV